ncbi:MAG: DUF3575 domain-containing protein [Bacteroidetes bacterium]|nr:DUF3575 domain-containing protein [Bacteroidota bacterium]
MNKFLCIAISLIIAIPFLLPAQRSDSARIIPKPIHKNVIKWNPTPMMLWSTKNVTLSYERVLNKRQSIALTVGYLEFPSLTRDSIAGLVAITSREKHGINLALEYRFYLMQRNFRPIPDGLYLSPFVSFYGYRFKNGLDLKGKLDSAFAIKGSFYVYNAGVELGYQFVFFKRFTLDLVLIGPSVSYYGGGLDISGNMNLSDIQDINEDLYKKLKEKYPMIGDFVVNKSFKRNGKLDLFSVGFRYLIQFGFHF